MSRKIRGITQKLYLVEIDDVKNKYTIKGTTGNIYDVHIKNVPTCTCPDYLTRYKRCKHIYFVLMKVMKIDEYMVEFDSFTIDELKMFYNNIPKITDNLKVSNHQYDKYIKLKKTNNKQSVEVKQQKLNDLCPICLEDFKKNEKIVYCKYSCGKNVHSVCFKMWAKGKHNITCIFCRTKWNSNVDQELTYIKI